MAYLRCLPSLENVDLGGDEQLGLKIIMRALEEPARQIAANAGEEGSVIVQKIKEKSGAFGFNAETAKFEDLIEAGVIDPTKVTRTALLNAASVSALMLTTECMVAELPKEDKGAPGMGGMPPGGGMY